MKQTRNFTFTEKELKEKMFNGTNIFYSDSACPCLACLSLKDGNGAYVLAIKINNKYIRKTIGNIYRTPLETARAIVRNIIANKEEFAQNELKRCEYLATDFNINGFYPRKKPEIKLDEDALLEEIERLKKENNLLRQKLKKIENFVVFNEE